MESQGNDHSLNNKTEISKSSNSVLDSGMGSSSVSSRSTCLSKKTDLPPLHQRERRLSNSTEKKSVTFSFSGSEHSNCILNASDCLNYMRKGSEMMKLYPNGRSHKRLFYYDDHTNSIKWTSTNRRSTNSQIHIDEIHEIQLGCSSRTTHSLGRKCPNYLTPNSSINHNNNNNNLLSTGGYVHSTNRNHLINSNNMNNFNLSTNSIGFTHLSSLSINSSSLIQLNLSSNAFTICYGPDFTILEILASNSEEANIWVTGLKCLMTGAQDPQILAERQKPRDRWLQAMFYEADVNQQGYLTEFDVVRLIRSINPNLSPMYLRHKLKETENKLRDHKGKITRDDFVTFFKKIATRQEIYYVLIRYASGSEHLTPEDLRNFLESEQGRVGLTIEQCENLINRFEPSPENRQFNCLGIDGFTLLLLSEECDIFNPIHLQVCQDMSQPITHYYIASSHKTPIITNSNAKMVEITSYTPILEGRGYENWTAMSAKYDRINKTHSCYFFLLEDQLTGPCSLEGYQRALLSGCRYIEIEIYDGHDGHPVVRRANSRPPGVPIQAVLNTIRDFAFIRSDYPVIISIECYASAIQQSSLVTFLRCCLGHRLLLPSSGFKFSLSESQLEAEDHVDHSVRSFSCKDSFTMVDLSDESTIYASDGSQIRWPSPRDLQGRILLKGKRLPKGTTTNDDHNSKWINGTVSTIRRTFAMSSFNSSLFPTTVIRELSDMFFFDSSTYDSVSAHNPMTAFTSLTQSNSLSSLGMKLSSANNHNNHNNNSNNNNNKSNSSLIIVGTHNETGSNTNYQINRHNTKFNEKMHKNYKSNKNDTLLVHPYHFITMTESEASRTIGYTAGELVKLTRNSMIQICPNPCRADSSNLNPIDIWSWGGQIVPLNYQTAGLVMDLATGFFARNGACGYVLKPILYRQLSSFFTPLGSNLLNYLDRPPDTTPQILRLKIVSAQQLPKPRGSVSKGDIIEPYVVVEIHGIPIDCAEQRTYTGSIGSASSYNVIFEDTFEFCIQLGSLALVRFVVLDDHAIGDAFIGQNTIPFDCLLSGFRHVRLRSDTGEPIPLATLFVHITITNKTDNLEDINNTGLLSKWRSRTRQPLQLKKIGVSSFDDVFKDANTTLRQSFELKSAALSNFDTFRRLCGETSTPLSMNQCIRAFSTRLSAVFGSPDSWPVRMRIRPEDEMPHLELQNMYGNSLSGFPSMNTLGETASRSSSMRFSPAPSLQRSPSLILSPRLFLTRKFKSSTKSIDEDSTSSLSIDIGGHTSTRENSPAISQMIRRPSINSSNSSISSFSAGRVDKLKKTVTEFESLIESCKRLIKQGPFLRVKLQQIQRTALEAYTLFLDGLKEPSTNATIISKLSSSSREHHKRDSSTYYTKGNFRSLKSDLVGNFSTQTGQNDDKIRSGSNTSSGGTSIYWKRMSRVADGVTWNLRLLTGQIEMLNTIMNESNNWLKQAKETSAATNLMISLDKTRADVSSITDSVSSPACSEYDQSHSPNSGEKNSSPLSPEILVDPPVSIQQSNILPDHTININNNNNSNINNNIIINTNMNADANLTRVTLTPLPENASVRSDIALTKQTNSWNSPTNLSTNTDQKVEHFTKPSSQYKTTSLLRIKSRLNQNLKK